ncbi:hypothetical protein EDB19DRAFT_1654677 [Suillus lakei]|nr:hypothetical protein EDB19DRAFT_1654677 [Suillus lakei]
MLSPFLSPSIDTAPSPLPSPLTNFHSLPASGLVEGPFYGETTPVVPWPSSRQAEFAAELCRLMLVCNVAWWAVDQPYWRAFFSKWIPQCLMPGSKQLSGRILDEEAGHVVEGVKMKVHGQFATGQCDGWKNINKTSIVASMINVEYTPYLLNTCDISTKPKTAENLLEIVLSEITYAVEVLKVKVVAWCTDASGDSAKMRCLLVQKIPQIIAVDCWAHQVCCCEFNHMVSHSGLSG